MDTFPRFLPHLPSPIDEAYLCKFINFYCLKLYEMTAGFKAGFFSKSSELCYVVIRKHIFEVLYLFFMPCSYMVFIHYVGNTLAFDSFVWKNTQFKIATECSPNSTIHFTNC